VKGDAKALDQILVNLIDNGVRDDGPGIADKHREEAYEGGRRSRCPRLDCRAPQIGSVQFAGVM